jgi:hypothetical protein
MLLFRSEEDLDRYCERRGTNRGVALPRDLAWSLSKAWFRSDDPREWRWPDAARARAIFDELGLVGPMWTL